MSSTALEDRLAREARDGDQRALAKIFSDYHQRLYRYCLAIVGNPQDAEDALQETMIKVLRSLPGEEREIALRPWLYRVAHNESIELLRRRRESVSLEQSEPTAGAALAEQVEVRERLRQLIADLGGLPERQRGVLLMREAAGLDFEEIGAALETTAAAARQTLYEARLGLREMDAGREMDCAAVTRALSDGDGRVRRRRDIRAHLRGCAACRQFAADIDSRRTDLAAIAPLPAVAAAALLHGVLAGAGGGAAAAGGAGAAGGGAAASGAGGVGALAAGGAAKSIGTATALKLAAAAAVVAGLGVGAADQAGVIHLGGKDPAPPARSREPDHSAEPARSPTHAAGSSAEGGEDSTGSKKSSGRGAHTEARRGLGASQAAAPPRPPGLGREHQPGADGSRKCRRPGRRSSARDPRQLRDRTSERARSRKANPAECHPRPGNRGGEPRRSRAQGPRRQGGERTPGPPHPSSPSHHPIPKPRRNRRSR